MSRVLFSRNFQRFQGGHLKVFHYFQHVRSSPRHEAWIRFTADSRWDASNPWWNERGAVLDGQGEIPPPDVLFLAGADWRWLEPDQRRRPPRPVINLIQGFHGPGREELNAFLAHPAIRLAVSAELGAWLERQGAQGPVIVVPIGLDLERLPAARPPSQRDLDCLVLAVKEPPLGRGIARRLQRAGHEVLLVEEPLSREELLDAMARARVAVHLPVRLEGAYLPALESMALETVVVCPDCIGNRSFCRDGDTCFVPRRSERAIARAASEALSASRSELAPMLAAAHAESRAHGLHTERSRFLAILDDVEELWQRATS
jgi:hypothetical protein